MNKDEGNKILFELKNRGLLVDEEAIELIAEKINSVLDDRIEKSKKERIRIIEEINDYSVLNFVSYKSL